MKKSGLLILTLIISLTFYGQNDWRKVIIDNSMSLSVPFEMNTIALDLDEETQKKVDKYISSSGNNSMETFAVAAVSAIYKPTITANIDGALKGIISNFSDDGKKKVQYEKKALNDFGIQGSSAIGYIEDKDTGTRSFFYSIQYGKENKYWNVIILHTKDNQESRDMAQQVFQSIKISL